LTFVVQGIEAIVTKLPDVDDRAVGIWDEHAVVFS